MDQTLRYLREVLSNYTEQFPLCQQIYERIGKEKYTSEGAFVRDLSMEEINFLNKILPDEINHARDVQDSERIRELNEVYELLF